MHAFVVLAIAFAMRENFILATISMVLAVNFKQTALYFALPFVVFTIAKLYERHHSPNIAANVDAVVTRCLALGVVFIATNALLWLPWWYVDGKLNLQTAQQVWNRVFPVRRGIFEDKVSTFWCVLHYTTPL